VIKYIGHEIASLPPYERAGKRAELIHKAQVDQGQIEERLARIEEALEQKADRDELYDCSNELEKLREDVGDLQGQLADAESRIDDLENVDWT
jgi:archaellum component FlaC